MTIPSDGVLVMGITRSGDPGFAGGGVGNYRLTISPEREPNNTCIGSQEFGAVALPFVQVGSIDNFSRTTPEDVDFFKLISTAGTTVQVDLEGGAGTGGVALNDPLLGAFDSGCNVLTRDDDGGTGVNARLRVTIPGDGILVLGVTSSGDAEFLFGGPMGSYRLTIAADRPQSGPPVTGTDDPALLAGSLAVEPPAGSSLEVDFPDESPHPQGAGGSPLAGFPTHASSFAVMTTGDAELADNPNDRGNSGFPHAIQIPGRGDAIDPQTLHVDVNVPSGANCLIFDFRFLSEEFPEFVQRAFNDAFIAELDQSTWSVSGRTISAPGNFASSAGDFISVDDQGPSGMSAEEALGTTYDGATQRLTAMTPVSPGPHTVFFSIFDAGDAINDSAVFIDNLRFGNLSNDACETPFEAELAQTRVACQGRSCRVPVTCNLPADVATACGNRVDLFVRAPRRLGEDGSTKARTRVRIAATVAANVPAGLSAMVKLRLTKAGKRLVKSGTKKLKGVFEIRNTPGSAIDSTPVTISIKKSGR